MQNNWDRSSKPSCFWVKSHAKNIANDHTTKVAKMVFPPFSIITFTQETSSANFVGRFRTFLMKFQWLGKRFILSYTIKKGAKLSLDTLHNRFYFLTSGASPFKRGTICINDLVQQKNIKIKQFYNFHPARLRSISATRVPGKPLMIMC
jgi:hypothetical protein